jgi:hypothetical protein
MFDPKASKRPKSKTPASPKSSPPKMTSPSAPVPSHDRIRERAYQLYENRGRQDGQAQQDWFMAERQVLNQHR